MSELRWDLAAAIDAALTEDVLNAVKKKLSDAASSLQEDIEYRLTTDLSHNLSSFANRMAEEAVKAILCGDEDAMRKYLSCQEGRYTGRDRDHHVIHGKLFETGAIELRKQIVNTFPELLRNERILDLESQLSSLVEQVRNLESSNERLRRETAA